MPLPPIVETLLDPGFYPHTPADVELRQTHISYVFLAGDQVFKLKKPVRFAFLDFTILERRRHFCREEVRLNRRLAPDVYLGVRALRRDGDSYRWTDEGDARAVEYLVHMRRLPDDRTLDRCLRRGAVDVATIDRLAALLVRFHRGAEVGDEITANGSIAAIERVLRQNYEGTAPFHGVIISAADDAAIQRFARDFLVRNEALFRRRQAERRIRDGHADLHADHVYLTEPPVIVDCVEFSPTFRWCDVASDLSFLTMDLEYHDRPDLAARLVARYAALSGDAELARLVPFYACYRAYVRGKVDSLKSAEEDVDDAERERARESARRHFALAYRYTWAYSPALVVVAGRSDTGNSSVARALAARTGFGVIASDAVGKEPAGLAATEHAGGCQRDERHAAAMGERTDAELFARARWQLAAGAGVILDATFHLRTGCEEARRLAAAAGVPFLLVTLDTSRALGELVGEIERELHERSTK
ncbi:MAG TPA: AAA family ATPase [Candidatus Dormibacteraeota bacterium]|nr:AAA family ATPase [Candidatus Dormibacteraeota bacterium]